MFSRRKNRTTHTTAYTGVNQLSVNTSAQPDTNALAAALTIGNALKQNQPPKIQNGSISRSSSFQVKYNTAVNPQRSSGSLLKRNSVTNKTKSPNSNRDFRSFSNQSIDSKSTPPSRRGSISTPSKIVYDIDDSFNDSYLDEITEEATKEYYNNHANLKDLKLSHSPNTSYRRSSLRPSSESNTHITNGNVKMVKKYVPTPNGIKVIEVPETKLADEFARSNSIRMGKNISRSGSMNNLSNKAIPRSSSLNSVSLQNKRRAPSRLSSLVGPPKMASMAENVELEDSSDDTTNDVLYHNLQKKIDHEKKMAKELEHKRLEYQKLKEARIKREKELLSLEKEASSNFKESEVNEEFVNGEKSESIIKPQLSSLENEGESKEESEDEEGILADSTINASSVVVDELEKKEIEQEGPSEEVEGKNLYEPNIYASGHNFSVSNSSGKGSTSLFSQYSDSDNVESDNNTKKEFDSNAELGIITQYGESKSTEFLNPEKIIEHPLRDRSDDESDNDTEIIDDNENKTNLAKSLRPTFDAVPEIIDDQKPIEVSDTLELPSPMNLNGSSNSSLHSSGSDFKVKPVKSAMKNSSSFYNSPNNSSKSNNAAHQAYLSLTTAENTRLNSKLSSGQLDDFIGPTTINQSNSPVSNKQKRMSQSLRRNSPQANAPGLSSRSLRPQSVQQPSDSNNMGFNSKSLRTRPTSYVSNIPAHPALQPNYESPSKLRAAELYAKANTRPHSVFNPPIKRSSFSRESQTEIADEVLNGISNRDFSLRERSNSNGHRMSLRKNGPQHNQSVQKYHKDNAVEHLSEDNLPKGQNASNSRYSDFDGEFSSTGVKGSGNFTSRFADSDDEDVHSPKHGLITNSHLSTQHHNQPQHQIHVPSLRSGNSKPGPAPTPSQAKSANPKEKKKFGGKLRKLFGRSDN